VDGYPKSISDAEARAERLVCEYCGREDDLEMGMTSGQTVIRCRGGLDCTDAVRLISDFRRPGDR
jgi:hypothetical protein